MGRSSNNNNNKSNFINEGFVNMRDIFYFLLCSLSKVMVPRICIAVDDDDGGGVEHVARCECKYLEKKWERAGASAHSASTSQWIPFNWNPLHVKGAICWLDLNCIVTRQKTRFTYTFVLPFCANITIIVTHLKFFFLNIRYFSLNWLHSYSLSIVCNHHFLFIVVRSLWLILKFFQMK